MLVTLFWVMMNVLLWRQEYGDRSGSASTVPATVVWEKMLTAPDTSSLTIFHKGRKIGFCHWITSVSEQLSQVRSDEAPPEGMVGRVNNYRIQLEGNVAPEELQERLRFDGHLTLSRDHQWQEFGLRLNLRPGVWEIRSSAAERTLHVNGQDGQVKFQRVYQFSELQNPTALVGEIAGPLAAGMVSTLGLIMGPGAPLTNANDTKGSNSKTAQSGADQKAAFLVSLGGKWEARHDSVKIGHSSAPAYRLHTRFLNRYDAVLFISRVGEILRVELPDQIVLVNDQMAGF